ncbi:MAG: HTH domain-containing protein [Clostridia bacterium]|nr:HTH domain-containing protein [Clostridia bacterium]
MTEIVETEIEMTKLTASVRREIILDILQCREIVTAKELASRFHVDRRTIYNDIDYLQGHYLIERVRSRYGGYRYIGPKLNREVVLSRNELDIIRRLGREVKLEHRDKVVYNRAVKKLEKQAALLKIQEDK